MRKHKEIKNWHRSHQCVQKRILIVESIENSKEEDDLNEGEI